MFQKCDYELLLWHTKRKLQSSTHFGFPQEQLQTTLKERIFDNQKRKFSHFHSKHTFFSNAIYRKYT